MKMEKAIKIYDKPLYIQKMKFDDNMMSITEKVIAYQVEKMDDFICESIIECLPDDVTKVLFLDKNKIAEIFRRQVNNGWIPASERLPNRETGCLVWQKIDGHYKYNIWHYATDFPSSVIAWQPLPPALGR